MEEGSGLEQHSGAVLTLAEGGRREASIPLETGQVREEPGAKPPSREPSQSERGRGRCWGSEVPGRRRQLCESPAWGRGGD